MVRVLKAGMSHENYTPGSVAKLLGTESAASVHETKLQVMFSEPAALSHTPSAALSHTQAVSNTVTHTISSTVIHAGSK